MEKTLELGIRNVLPEDLRYLLRKHPREGWRNQPGLAGTGEIWLANRDWFRAITMRRSTINCAGCVKRARRPGTVVRLSIATSAVCWAVSTAITGSRTNTISRNSCGSSRA